MQLHKNFLTQLHNEVYLGWFDKQPAHGMKLG